jgi:hypothetical protein
LGLGKKFVVFFSVAIGTPETLIGVAIEQLVKQDANYLEMVNGDETSDIALAVALQMGEITSSPDFKNPTQWAEKVTLATSGRKR